MVNSMVLDFAVIALIVLAALEGRRKGFIKMLWRVAAWIFTLVLVMALIEPVTEWAMTTDTVQGIIGNITAAFEKDLFKSNIEALTPEAIAEVTGIPQILIPADAITGAGQNFTAAAMSLASSLAEIVIKVAVALILFVVIRLVLSVVYHVLDLASKLPIIKGLNRLLGMTMGIINILFVLYIVLGIVALNIEIGSQWNIVINNTYLVKNFYNNNILLSLIS